MANTLINSTLLSKEAAVEFRLNNTFLATANRKYDTMYTDATYESGDTVNIRLDNQFIVKRGETVTASDIKETNDTITLQSLYSVPVTYTTTDLTTKLRINWMERVFKPAVRALAAEVNKDIAADAATSLYIHNGTPGTAISTFATVDAVGATMQERGISPADPWYMTLGPRDSTSLKSSLQNAFNTTLNTEISLRSQLGRLSYFDMFTDQSIATHTPYTGGVMTAGSIQVNATVATGSTIVLKGLTPTITGIFKAGDVIQIAGVQSVNRVNRVSTGQDMQFRITADANSDGGGLATVTVYPPINSDVTDPNRNVTGSVLINSAVLVNGVDGTVTQVAHKVNTAYNENGLYVVTPRLARLDTPESSVFNDTESGLSLRVSKSAEILDNKNVIRIDLLAGYKWMGQSAVRLMS
jgi:hypothetical protein